MNMKLVFLVPKYRYYFLLVHTHVLLSWILAETMCSFDHIRQSSERSDHKRACDHIGSAQCRALACTKISPDTKLFIKFNSFV